MRDAQHGTVKVHKNVFKIAKAHMLDWFVMIFLGLLVIGLDHIHPYHSFIGKDTMTDLRCPLHNNTLPAWTVPIISLFLPFIICLAFYVWRRDTYDIHHGILGLLFSVLITAVITNVIKDSIGRPRPDFFWRCFPDGNEMYSAIGGNVVCHGKASVIREGYKSFPSGHTSWCFAGLGFLSLYLSGKLKAFNQKGRIAKLCVVFLPLLAATLVGISRVNDCKHTLEDIYVGALLGMTMAIFCYLQFFPAPFHPQGSRTYSYTTMSEASHDTANPSANSINQQQQATTATNNGSTRDDLETGRAECSQQ